VFRQQYIPQTLEQVYDIERDAEQVGKGGADGLVYKALLADKVVPTAAEPAANGASADESADQEDGGASLDDSDDEDSDEDDESRFEKGTPRGKRFEDKDAKKVWISEAEG
jgi:RIO kinase 1